MNTQNLSLKPLYITGISAVIVGLLSMLLMRLELQAPGIQFFSDPATYNTMVRLHSDTLVFQAYVGLVFGALGYAFLPSRLEGPISFGQKGINVIATFWAISIVLLLVGFLPLGGVSSSRPDGWVLYPPLGEAGSSAWSFFAMLASRLFAYLATILTILVLLVSCLSSLGKGQSFWRASSYVWSIICTGILLGVFVAISAWYEFNPRFGTTFFDPSGAVQSTWKLEINSSILVLSVGLLCVACEGMLKRALVAPFVASIAIVLFTAFSLSGGPLYWVQTILQTNSNGLINVLALFPQFLLGLVQFICLISIIALPIQKRGVLFWVLCAFVPAIFAMVLSTNQVTFGLSSLFRDTMHFVGQEHLLVFSLLIICPIAAIYGEFGSLRMNQSVKPFWSYTTLLLVVVGLSVTHVPQLFLGLQGMPRRYVDYPNAFSTWNLISSIGAYIIITSVVPFLISLWKTNAERSNADEVFG